jgi:hypothetical protein
MTVITDTELASYLRLEAPDAAVTLLTNLANGLVEDITGALAPVPTRVKTITLEVAARAYRNPHGYSSETVDDYTYRRDADTRQAGVYLTAAEAAELATVGGTGTGGAYSVSLWG